MTESVAGDELRYSSGASGGLDVALDDGFVQVMASLLAARRSV
jgi:hypothetical protein